MGFGMGFGAIAGWDYEPKTRVMLLAIDQAETEIRTAKRGHYSAVWLAIVLADLVWPVGHIVTIAADMSNFRVYENAEDL